MSQGSAAGSSGSGGSAGSGGGGSRGSAGAPAFRSEQLEEALAAQDVAAVAFALRHDVVVVPRLVTSSKSDEQVRVFGRENSEKRILLLFSSADTYAAMVPNEKTRLVMLYDAAKLRDFIEAHLDVLEQVFFDIAGPHTMAANPEDLLKALR